MQHAQASNLLSSVPSLLHNAAAQAALATYTELWSSHLNFTALTVRHSAGDNITWEEELLHCTLENSKRCRSLIKGSTLPAKKTVKM